MSNSKRVIKNTIFLYIRMVVSILVNVFTTNILLRALGASDYGLYNVVGGAVAMLNFLSASMSSVTQRFLNYAEGAGDEVKIIKIFNNAKVIHYAIALFTAVFLIGAGFAFFNGILNIPVGREFPAMIVYACLIFSIVFSITITPYDAVLNARENMLYYSILGIVDVIAKLFIAVAIMYADIDRLILYAVLMAAESWLFRLVTKNYCTKHYTECKPGLISKNIDRKIIKEMSSFAGWNTLNITTGMLSLYGMNIILNHFYGTMANAAMGIATQVTGVLMGVSGNMLKALTPMLVKSEASQQRTKMLDISYIGCKYSYLLFSFFCIPIFIVMPTVLELWLGEVPEWTSLFCRLMIISTLVEQLFVFLYQTINAHGNIRNYNIMRSVTNILPIVSSVICCNYGMPAYWVIINWIIFKAIVGGVVNLYYSNKNVGLEFSRFINRVVLPTGIVTIIPIVLYKIYTITNTEHSTNVHDIVVMFCLFAINIPLYLYLGMEQTERERIFKLIKR